MYHSKHHKLLVALIAFLLLMITAFLSNPHWLGADLTFEEPIAEIVD